MSTFVPNQAGLHILLNSPSGEVSRFMLRQGILVTNLAKSYCPVDTGRLRASIGVDQSSDGSVTVGSNVEYAIYVEAGTRYQRAQPYLRPALDQVVGGLR